MSDEGEDLAGDEPPVGAVLVAARLEGADVELLVDLGQGVSRTSTCPNLVVLMKKVGPFMAS